jgi:hypothetical protein
VASLAARSSTTQPALLASNFTSGRGTGLEEAILVAQNQRLRAMIEAQDASVQEHRLRAILAAQEARGQTTREGTAQNGSLQAIATQGNAPADQGTRSLQVSSTTQSLLVENERLRAMMDARYQALLAVRDESLRALTSMQSNRLQDLLVMPDAVNAQETSLRALLATQQDRQTLATHDNGIRAMLAARDGARDGARDDHSQAFLASHDRGLQAALTSRSGLWYDQALAPSIFEPRTLSQILPHIHVPAGAQLSGLQTLRGLSSLNGISPMQLAGLHPRQTPVGLQSPSAMQHPLQRETQHLRAEASTVELSRPTQLRVQNNSLLKSENARLSNSKNTDEEKESVDEHQSSSSSCESLSSVDTSLSRKITPDARSKRERK